MHILLQLRSLLHHMPLHEPDPLRRVGYYDGEPRPRHRRHWANR